MWKGVGCAVGAVGGLRNQRVECVYAGGFEPLLSGESGGE